MNPADHRECRNSGCQNAASEISTGTREPCLNRPPHAAWGFELCARRPALYSDTVTAIVVPEDFDARVLVNQANEAYGVSFGIGLGTVAERVFRIGHLGHLTESMALAGIATAEMAMRDLGYPVRLGSGVAAAQGAYQARPEAYSSTQRQVAAGEVQ